MYGEAAFAANKTDAATNGLRFKPLSAEVRAIADKPPALSETQEDGAVATNLGDDLREEAQAGGGWGQGTPVVQEGGVKRSLYSVTKRRAGSASWRRSQQGKRREEAHEFHTRRQQRRRGRTSRGRSRGRGNGAKGRRRPGARQGAGVPAHAQHWHEAT